MEVDSGTAGGVNPHAFVTVLTKEEVPVVGGNHRLFDAGSGQAREATSEILNHTAHNHAGERRGALAGLVDLLRANDHDLRVPDLGSQRLGSALKDGVQGQVDGSGK